MNTTKHAIESLSFTLKKDLQRLVAKQLTEQLVSDFKQRIEPLVTKAVKDITVEHVQAMRDQCAMKEEISLIINGVALDENL